ncbi:MAG TPA: peroxidase family protein [Solirubrobacteraceae bacterium]|jgi:hypothetical protein
MKPAAESRTAQSRREFLKGVAGAGVVAGSLGAGVAVSPPSAAASPLQSAARQRGRGGGPASSDDFGRMFPHLRPFAEANDRVRAALLDVGRQGGVLDAQDDLAAGPTRLIVDPTVNGNPTATDPYGSNPDNPTMTAGSTFVGQFTDHDITFDQTSRLGVPQDPLISPNTRTPALDLDSVFGGGSGIRPDLYVDNADGSVGPKLKIGSGGVHEDVPRLPNGDGTYTALLGDPRNDENVIVAGLHCAHVLIYNRVVDELSEFDLSAFPANPPGARPDGYAAFLLARQVTLWHYQWLLVNEHLPQIAGQAVVDDVLQSGGRFYTPPPGDAFMPIEFGAACYRFGHSMVRPSYRANFTCGTGDSTSPTADPFFALVFDPDEPDFSAPPRDDRDDLLGGFPAPRRYVGWQTFFDFGDGQVKNNKRIDTTISSVLFTLPVPAIAPRTQTAPTVLPQRNLLRQLTWGLPSGQALAREIGVPPLSTADLAEIAAVHRPFAVRTPLWYYILAEAKAAADGLNLGPVGGRVVAETLIGLLRADPTSYLTVCPGFTPFLGSDLRLGPGLDPNITGNRTYTRAHFLYYAGVVTPGTYR